MNDKPDMKLVRVLRFVLEKSVFYHDLVRVVSKDQFIAESIAESYISELADLGYLSVGQTVVEKGETPFPDQLLTNGRYLFRSECWNCGTEQEQKMSIDVKSLWYFCPVCNCKWREIVND